jgi:hypothetical protein
MVIWFNNDKARGFLLKQGFVYTLRPKKRREGVEPLFWQKFKKRGTVKVRYIGEIGLADTLLQYVPYSGFGTLDEWLKEAKGSRHLYRVDLISLEQKDEGSFYDCYSDYVAEEEQRRRERRRVDRGEAERRSFCRETLL